MKTFSAELLLNKYGRNESATSLGEIFGVSRTTICRWRNTPSQAWISAYNADKYACKIGLHPANIWENWFNS